MDDKALKDSIENDPFHKGLAEHSEFKGFVAPPMSDEEVEASKSKLSRIFQKLKGKA